MTPATRDIAAAALLGVAFGLGLGLASNVSGVVLALYGFVLSAVFAAVVLAWRRRAGRR